MPAQERVRLDDQQGLPPATDAAGKEHEHRAVGRGAAGALDAALEDRELLPQQDILSDQLGPTAAQIGERPRNERGCDRLRRSGEVAAEGPQGRTRRASMGGSFWAATIRGRARWRLAATWSRVGRADAAVASTTIALRGSGICVGSTDAAPSPTACSEERSTNAKVQL